MKKHGLTQSPYHVFEKQISRDQATVQRLLSNIDGTLTRTQHPIVSGRTIVVDDIGLVNEARGAGLRIINHGRHETGEPVAIVLGTEAHAIHFKLLFGGTLL